MYADLNEILRVELIWILLPIVLAGSAWLYFQVRRRKQRSVERSKRPIPVYGNIGVKEAPHLLRAAVCKVLGHNRSKRRVRRDSETGLWRTVCKRCGCKLQKTDETSWRSDA